MKYGLPIDPDLFVTRLTDLFLRLQRRGRRLLDVAGPNRPDVRDGWAHYLVDSSLNEGQELAGALRMRLGDSDRSDGSIQDRVQVPWADSVPGALTADAAEILKRGRALMDALQGAGGFDGLVDAMAGFEAIQARLARLGGGGFGQELPPVGGISLRIVSDGAFWGGLIGLALGAIVGGILGGWLGVVVVGLIGMVVGALIGLFVSETIDRSEQGTAADPQFNGLIWIPWVGW